MTAPNSDDIETVIREAFALNLEAVQIEGGHALAPEVRAAALDQVLLYWRRLRHVAEKVTDTEVRLHLPGQETPRGRKFGIGGVVDIVREQERTTMYDIKTHDADYVRDNPDLYEKQLNIYAHIWQTLRGEPLHETAVICTAFPAAIKAALATGDDARLAAEVEKWDPLVPIDFDQNRVEETIADFKRVVDLIEDRDFAPPGLDVLKSKPAGARTVFAVSNCRNCDARFSCSSYRQYALGSRSGDANAVRQYFADIAPDVERDDWTVAALDVAPVLDPADYV